MITKLNVQPAEEGAVADVNGGVKGREVVVEAPEIPAPAEKRIKYIHVTRNMLLDVGNTKYYAPASMRPEARNKSEYDVIKPAAPHDLEPSHDTFHEFVEGPGTKFPKGDACYLPKVRMAERYYDSDDDNDYPELTIKQLLDCFPRRVC